MSSHPLADIIARHKAGSPEGIWSACTAHRTVLEACLQQAADDGGYVCIESTCNQVDQFGGYSGMTPSRFVQYVREICRSMKFPFERVILGGDHLGPNSWRKEPSGPAMTKALDLVRAYVQAGYTKIHLDASMRLADDTGNAHGAIEDEVVAQRAAELCAAAEEAWVQSKPGAHRPLYVIGTEVPIPGGAQEAEMHIRPTSAEAAAQTIEITRKAFMARGLEAAWQRVCAVVVQPGVEFSDNAVCDYNRAQARALSQFIAGNPQLVYEAHSTDYQTTRALREMVEDHFAILKVGPGVTYVYREGLFALESIEREWLGDSAQLSNLRSTLEARMLALPQNWKSHYHGDEATLALARKYSYSDRSRYYWADAQVQAAVDRLISNLVHRPAPLTVISQFLPEQYWAIRAGEIRNDPMDLLRHKIRKNTEMYARACSAEALYCNRKSKRLDSAVALDWNPSIF